MPQPLQMVRRHMFRHLNDVACCSSQDNNLSSPPATPPAQEAVPQERRAKQKKKGGKKAEPKRTAKASKKRPAPVDDDVGLSLPLDDPFLSQQSQPSLGKTSFVMAPIRQKKRACTAAAKAAGAGRLHGMQV